MVKTLLTLLTNLLVLGGLSALSYFTVRLVLAGKTYTRRALRLFPLVAGLLAYQGSRLLGMDLPTMLLRSLEISFPAVGRTIALVTPGVAGIVVAHFLTKSLTGTNASDRLINLVIMITTFFVAAFSDLYSEGLTTQGSHTFGLLPNVTFILSIALYLSFKSDITAIDPLVDEAPKWYDKP